MQVYCAPICGLLETKILEREREKKKQDASKRIIKSATFSLKTRSQNKALNESGSNDVMCGSCGMTEDVFGDRRVSTHVSFSHNETRSARGSGSVSEPTCTSDPLFSLSLSVFRRGTHERKHDGQWHGWLGNDMIRDMTLIMRATRKRKKKM